MLLQKGNEFHLNIYGITVCIAGNEAARDIAADFEFFQCEPMAQPQIHLQLVAVKPQAQLLPTQVAAQIRSDCVVYDRREGANNIRWIDYHGEALLRRKTERNFTHGELFCSDPALTHELAYLFLHSEIGKRLDQKGLHRVHGLGIANKNCAALVLLPSGGGKSTTAIHLLDQYQLSLLSDDSPLVNTKGELLSYPLRLAFTPQTELPLVWEKKAGQFQRRKFGAKKVFRVSDLPRPPVAAAHSFKKNIIIIGRRWGSLAAAETYALPKRSALPLLVRDLVVGVGLPQVAELLLGSSWQNIRQLSPLAAKRTLALVNLIRRADVYELRMSHKPEKNAAAIANLVDNA